jgi:1-deoxy-D-xylulose-5-phosphate synthase
MSPKEGPVLSKVNSVEDLRSLNPADLPQLCKEIREFIIDVVSHRPGHLGANLGTVELAVALHYVFNTPEDKLIWDVGHQAYTHKILTGRKTRFYTNRSFKGISGYPKMSESEFDAFGTGHSSTSISAALGMAIASKLQGDRSRQHIAVIGDGSMTAGMAFEAMNHAGVSNTNLLVVLNDNGIAIDKNVGALKEYLTNITTSRFYNRLKVNVWNIIRGKHLRRFIKKVLFSTKTAIVKQSNLFESLNFRYFGPVDGHDVQRLIKIFDDLKDIPGPKLLHCITVKGKGFQRAEKEQTTFHAPGVFDKETGEIAESNCSGHLPKLQVVFGKTLVELAESNPAIVGITPAMLTGCSMNMMAARFPDRTFDVGIAEQHAVTFSAGMAVRGLLPYCNIYSSFLQRAYDQVVHDVALQNLHVVFCIDRGGLVGEDGATHHGAFDLSYLNSIPNMTVAAPLDENDLRNLLYSAQFAKGPYAIRYPRANAMGAGWKKAFEKIPSGKGQRLREGKQVAVLSIGHVGHFALQAADQLALEGMEISVYDLRFLKPLDEDLLHEALIRHKYIVTVEDGCIKGGMGSEVLRFMAEHSYHAVIRCLGIPDHFIEQGSPAELFRECGYDAEGIAQTLRTLVREQVTQ